MVGGIIFVLSCINTEVVAVARIRGSGDNNYDFGNNYDNCLESCQTKSHRGDGKPDEMKELFPEYRIGTKLGEGSFGVVKLATHTVTGEQVAIKCLKIKRRNEADEKGKSCEEKIRKEIDIMKKLDHPNVIKLLDQREAPSKNIYLVMEAALGGDFFDYVAPHLGRMPEVEIQRFFRQMIDALEYLHKNGVAHRDLKPENIVLQRDAHDVMNIKICDFGLSKSYNEGQNLNTGCGTDVYIPPEIYHHAPRGYNPLKRDIWSIGVILFIFCAGKFPFSSNSENRNDAEASNQVMYAGLDWGETWSCEDAKNLVRGMLEKDPRERFDLQQIRNDKWFNKVCSPITSIEDEKIKLGLSLYRTATGQD